MRKFLYGVLALLVLVVAAALIGPSAIDWNDYKPEIARAVEARTGRALAIGGNLDLRLLPSPSFEAADVRLASIPGATFPDLVRLEAIRARLRLAPLLSGRVDIESLTLIRPVVELERLEDGRVSWALGMPPAPPPKAAAQGPALPPAAPQPAPAPAGGAASAFRLERLSIRDGTVIYRAPGGIERVEGLDAEVVAASLTGPFRAEGKLRARDLPLTFEATLAALAERAPTPLNLQLGLAGSDAVLDVKGWIAEVATAPRLDVKLSFQGGDFADAARRLARVAGGGDAAPPAAFARPFTVLGALKADRVAAVLDDLDVRLGEASLAGRVELGLQGTPSLQARLRLAPLDLDAWLAAAPAGGRRATRPAPSADGAQASGPFALPREFSAFVELTTEGVKYGGRRVQDLRLAAALGDGELTLSQLSMRLPGGTEASLVGFLVAKEGRPAYEGSLDARADDLRGLIGWLGVDVPAISPDRLRKLELAGRIRGDDGQVQLADIKVRLDASRITGGVTLAFRDRPAFGARFSVDQINVDAYLPADGKKAAAAPAGAPARPQGQQPSPLSVLERFDANLALRVGTLTYRRTPVQGIEFDGTLVRGTLTVREAQVRSLAGATLGLAGTFRGFQAVPTFNGTFRAGAENVTGLARLAGIATPVAAEAYGRLALAGKAETSADALAVEATLGLAGGEVALTGKATGLQAAAPRLELDLRGSHPELARLARLGGLALADPGERLGAFRFSGKLRGGMDALDVEARVVSLGGETELSGRLGELLTAPKGAGTLRIAFPELAILLRRLDPAYRPARARLGPVRIETRLAGDAASLRLTDLTAALGPAALTGSAELGLAGARPKLVAALAGGVIPLEDYLPDTARRVPASPAALAAPLAPRANGAGRWDATPIDFAALGLADADLKLTAEAVTLDALRIDRPVLEATLVDRVLTLSRLDGAVFGGKLSAAGALDGRDRPALTGRVGLTGANVGKALFETASLDLLGGVLGLEADLAAAGRSQSELVRTLSGKGRFAITGGTIKGFDLAAVGERLSNLDRAIDLLGVLGSATSGGTTKFDRLAGTFTVTKGVLKTDDTEIAADSGTGTARGTVDLPGWATDIRASFTLAKPGGVPPFAVRVHGPLDDPEKTFEADQVQAFLVSRGVGRLLKRIQPAKPAPSAAQEKPKPDKPVEPSKPSKSASPEDLLRGLLQGLTRGRN